MCAGVSPGGGRRPATPSTISLSEEGEEEEEEEEMWTSWREDVILHNWLRRLGSWGGRGWCVCVCDDEHSVICSCGYVSTRVAEAVSTHLLHGNDTFIIPT